MIKKKQKASIWLRELDVIEQKHGNQLVEWIIVTLLLTLATYALLQVVGPDVEVWVQRATQWLGRLWGAP